MLRWVVRVSGEGGGGSNSVGRDPARRIVVRIGAVCDVCTVSNIGIETIGPRRWHGALDYRSEEVIQ